MSKELTEQYYTGTLPSGHYYFSNGNSVYPIDYIQVEPFLCANGITVLCEVPSYQEYQALLSDSLAKNEGVEIIAELESKLSAISEQLKEANDVIRFYANDYLTKYGVEK